MNYLLILFIQHVSIFPIDIKLAYLEYRTSCTFKINSANRTIGHNLSVGGSIKSRHLVNKSAYDLSIDNCKMNYNDIGIFAKDIFGGVIVYRSHIHVDTRNKKLFISYLY